MTDYNWSSDEILDTPMNNNDADAETIREYLIQLLAGVWTEGEGFDGKRPFGNSDWQYEIYDALTKHRDFDHHDEDAMDAAITTAIWSMFR